MDLLLLIVPPFFAYLLGWALGRNTAVFKAEMKGWKKGFKRAWDIWEGRR